MSLEELPPQTKTEVAVRSVVAAAHQTATYASVASDTARHVYNSTVPVVKFLVYQTPTLAIAISIILFVVLTFRALQRSVLADVERSRASAQDTTGDARDPADAKKTR